MASSDLSRLREEDGLAVGAGGVPAVAALRDPLILKDLVRGRNRVRVRVRVGIG